MVQQITDENHKCLKITFKHNQILYKIGESYEDIQLKLGIGDPYLYSTEGRNSLLAYSRHYLRVKGLPFVDIQYSTVKEALERSRNKAPGEAICVSF